MAHRALKPLFASKYEKAADAVLQRIAQGGGDRLNVQTSVSQLVDVDDPELLAVADKRFMLEATFDFVFTRDDEPIFVVEIDGARHARDVATIRRDIKKDAICAVLGLPILRMSTALAIMQDGKRTILEYVADTYYLAEAFYEAQQSGTIPWDEPFFRGSLVEQLPNGETRRGLESAAIAHLAECEELGLIPHRVPNTLVIREPRRREVRCHAYLAVADDRFICADVYVRDFSFVGITPGELAEGLAIIELSERTRKWVSERDAPVATNRRCLSRVLVGLQQAVDAGLFVSAGHFRSNSTVGGKLPSIVISFGRGTHARRS